MPAWINKKTRKNGGKEKSGFNRFRLSGGKAFSHDYSNRLSVAFLSNWGSEVPTDQTSTSIISEVMQLKITSFHLNYPGSYSYN